MDQFGDFLLFSDKDLRIEDVLIWMERLNCLLDERQASKIERSPDLVSKRVVSSFLQQVVENLQK